MTLMKTFIFMKVRKEKTHENIFSWRYYLNHPENVYFREGEKRLLQKYIFIISWRYYLNHHENIYFRVGDPNTLMKIVPTFPFEVTDRCCTPARRT